MAASWARLGRHGGLLGPSWASLGSRNRTPSRPNIDSTIDQNFDAFEDRLLGGFWEVKWGQVGSKIEAKIDLKSKGRKSTKR